jgi:hypothetical protein
MSLSAKPQKVETASAYAYYQTMLYHPENSRAKRLNLKGNIAAKTLIRP